MFVINHRQKILWLAGIVIATILSLVWNAMNDDNPSPKLKKTLGAKTEMNTEKEIKYQYIHFSRPALQEEINRQFPPNAYQAQLEQQEQFLQHKLSNADLVERLVLERETTLLRDKIVNSQQYYEKKLALLVDVYWLLEKNRDEFGPGEYNQAQSALINGKPELAEGLLAKVDAKYRITLGGAGIDRAAEAVHQQGRIAEERLDYRKAYQYYRQAVKYDPGNTTYLVDAARIADNIALYNKAILFYEAALGILREGQAGSSDKIRQLLISLGKVWGSKGEPDRAVEYFELSLTHDIDAFGRTHRHVAQDHEYLGAAWENQGNHQKAKEHYDQAVKIYQAELGNTHPVTASAWENLERLIR